jgi:hypothetical protein
VTRDLVDREPRTADHQNLAHFLDALLPGNGFARTFSGSGIRLGSLTADGQAAAMSRTAIAVDVFQPLDILLNLATQRSFNGVVTVEDRGQSGQVVVAQFLCLALGIDAGLIAQMQSRGRTDAVDVAQRNMCGLIVRDVHTQDTRHVENLLGLALALFVARILTNDDQPAAPADNLAFLADSFDARSHLHRPAPGVSSPLHVGETIFLSTAWDYCKGEKTNGTNGHRFLTTLRVLGRVRHFC